MPHARAATPTSPTSGPLRGVRAAVVATATVLLAVAAHELGGGMPASAPVLLGLGAAASVLALVLSGRRWGTTRLIGVLALGQAALHLVCSWTHDPAMVHGSGSTTAGEIMLLWHAVATLLTVAVVRHGEDALWSLVDSLGLGPARLVRTIGAPPVAERRAALPVAPHVPQVALLAVTTRRRGPPVAAAR